MIRFSVAYFNEADETSFIVDRGGLDSKYLKELTST